MKRPQKAPASPCNCPGASLSSQLGFSTPDRGLHGCNNSRPCATALPRYSTKHQQCSSQSDLRQTCGLLMALDSYLNTGTVACKCLWQSRPHELVWSRSSQGKIAKPPHTKPKYIHLVLLWGASSRSMVTSGSLLRHWCCCLMAEMPWSTERGDHEANTSLSPNSRVVQRS